MLRVDTCDSLIHYESREEKAPEDDLKLNNPLVLKQAFWRDGDDVSR